MAAFHYPKVNASRCVRVLTNFYSAPLPVGLEVQVKVHSAYVQIWHQGECVAGGFFFQSQMHPFMTTILLGMSRLNPFDPDSQP